eukprot:719075-Amphidinium_carterae.1
MNLGRSSRPQLLHCGPLCYDHRARGTFLLHCSPTSRAEGTLGRMRVIESENIVYDSVHAAHQYRVWLQRHDVFAGSSSGVHACGCTAPVFVLLTWMAIQFRLGHLSHKLRSVHAVSEQSK